MVVDTSALLSVVLHEALGDWVAEQLNSSATPCRMSAVHYTETLILVNDRRRALLPPLQEQLQRTPIEFVSVTPTQAEIAAEARAKYPLNLGDCFAYALAKDLDLPLLTLDRDFRRTDVRLVVQPGFHRHARRPR